MSNVLKISNAKIIDNDKITEGKAIYVSDGKITAVTNEQLPFDTEYDAKGNYASSGFIDMHVHGGDGCDFMDDKASVLKAAKFHLNHGTTTILPTTMTSSDIALETALINIREVFGSDELLPNFPGVHLEGPYFSYGQRGAQNPDYLKCPKESEYKSLYEKYGDIIKRISLAAELDGAVEMCRYMSDRGVLMSVGHSDALYEDVLKAYENGATLLTHFYSGMSSITRHSGFRMLGVVEAGYMIDGMDIEIIADGKHLPPNLLKMIFKLKDHNRISLITDAIRAAGACEGFRGSSGPEGESTDFVIEDGVAKMTDKSGFVGSIATTDILVRTIVNQVGICLPEAIRLITKHPARVLKIDHKKGSICDGFDADINIFDDDINIKQVFVMGKHVK